MSDFRSPGQFTADELENSVPFDPDLRLSWDSGGNLLARVLEAVRSAQPERGRELKARDLERLQTTVSAFLGNLLAARRNRHSPEVFVAVSFDNSYYSGRAISATVMQKVRDVLWAAGFVEGQLGFRKAILADDGTVFGSLGKRTRLRATPLLLRWIEEAGIVVGAPFRDPTSGLGRDGSPELLASPRPDGPEPTVWRGWRTVVAHANRLTSSADIDLPLEQWDLVRPDARGDDDEALERRVSGDVSRTSLYRRFARSWERGGRLYGGFWQGLPKPVRPWLTIDGATTVELDYGRLHPTLLYRRAGLMLEVDPYLPEGFDRGLRDIGKTTFNVLLNSTRPLTPKRLWFTSKARELMTLEEYVQFLDALRRLHRPIASAFGSDEGARLQVIDSMILIEVLRRMNALGAVTLTIHDSFIVAETWEHHLRGAMADAYDHVTGYGTIPINKT